MTIRAYQNGEICLSLNGVVHRLSHAECKRLVAELEEQTAQKGSVGHVKRTVAGALDIPVAQLESHKRTDKLCVARWICWQLLRESGMTLQAIGDEFGGRDHGTVMSGLASLSDRMALKEPLKREIDLIRKRVGEAERK